MSKKGYGQFCPVAKAAEIVAERWTPLVLRELLCGSTRFSDLRRGVPLMSPSLLSRRLKELEDAGIVERRSARKGASAEYHLTEAGQALRPIVEMLGVWGNRWIMHDLQKEDLDPSLLMWDVRRRVPGDAVPQDRRVVVHFELGGVAQNKKRWWLVFDRGDVDLCMKPPGFGVDLRVQAHIRTLTEIWMGTRDLQRAVRGGDVSLDGPRDLVRAFPTWFSLSLFAYPERLAGAKAVGWAP